MTEELSEAEISMILDVYMYTNYEHAIDGQSLKEIIASMPEHFDTNKIHKNEYTILNEAVNNPKIGDLKICCQSQKMGYNSGTNAVTFTSPTDNKVYITYRGTADGEWYDNGQGMTKEWTNQQKEAVKYYDEVVDSLKLDNSYEIYVSGHSKGGNKVQFVTMDSKNADIITKTFSVDGQGQSKKAIARWQKKYSKEEYNERISKIYGINGENDFVSVLGTGIILAENISYIKTPVGTMEDTKIANIAGFHDMTYMFAKQIKNLDGKNELVFTGRRNEYVLKSGEFANWTRGLYEALDKYPDVIVDDNAKTLMQIVEIANKGKMTGINNEMVNMSAIKAFYYTGLPLILFNAFGSTKGRSLFSKVLNDGLLNDSINGATDIEVDYTSIFNLSEELLNVSNNLNALILKMATASMALPLFLDGNIYRKPNLDNSLVKLKELQQKLKRTANVLNKIASYYFEYDAKKIEL